MRPKSVMSIVFINVRSPLKNRQVASLVNRTTP